MGPKVLKIMNYEYILVNDQVAEYVAHIQLNRPKELNALNLQLMQEIKHALCVLDEDERVRAIVISGNERAFAAGAAVRPSPGAAPLLTGQAWGNADLPMADVTNRLASP